MTLLFATHNDHKVEELNQLLPDSISLISLNDIGCEGEIEETGASLEENAKIKADCARMKYGLDCFADDSGLEIEALDGAPGVYSARYGGEERDMDKNIQKVWNELKGHQNTRAWFRTVFYLHLEGKEYVFRGRVEGSIIFEKRGTKGFGYGIEAFRACSAYGPVPRLHPIERDRFWRCLPQSTRLPPHR